MNHLVVLVSNVVEQMDTFMFKNLKSLDWILHASLAKRDISIWEGGGDVFPLKFVN